MRFSSTDNGDEEGEPLAAPLLVVLLRLALARSLLWWSFRFPFRRIVLVGRRDLEQAGERLLEGEGARLILSRSFGFPCSVMRRVRRALVSGEHQAQARRLRPQEGQVVQFQPVRLPG